MKGNRIKLAIAGLGGRGYGTLEYILDTFKEVDVIAVCDVYEDRVDRAVERCRTTRPETEIKGYPDYKEMVQVPEIDAVLVSSAWDAHCEIALAAMKAGKYAGIECGGGYSVQQCWDLVRTYEATGNWCMFLENCCYNHTELTLLRMIKDGHFGEMIHCEGGYAHDLRDEITGGHVNRHYRFDNYEHRCGDFYPEHALGPIQKFLNINRGNRMLTLCSMASKARGLHDYIVTTKGEDHPDAKIDWKEGDVVQTMIKCANGETILLTHDTSLERPYARKIYVQGTGGLFTEMGHKIHIRGITHKNSDDQPWESEWEDFSNFEKDENFEHPLWKRFREAELKGGGHGGMDHLVLEAFFYSIEHDIEPPIDTYDAATLLAITPLSVESCAMGGHPVAIPDFTDGKWIKRGKGPRTIFTLDEVPYDLFKLEENKI